MKEKMKQIFIEKLGENATISDVVDHIFNNSIACGERITAYEINYEYEKRKGTEKSQTELIHVLAEEFRISYSTAFRYIKYKPV